MVTRDATDNIISIYMEIGVEFTIIIIVNWTCLKPILSGFVKAFSQRYWL